MERRVTGEGVKRGGRNCYGGGGEKGGGNCYGEGGEGRMERE